MLQYGKTERVTKLAACHRYENTHAVADTLEFIFHQEKPRDKKATYVQAAFNIQHQKA